MLQYIMVAAEELNEMFKDRYMYILYVDMIEMRYA